MGTGATTQHRTKPLSFEKLIACGVFKLGYAHVKVNNGFACPRSGCEECARSLNHEWCYERGRQFAKFAIYGGHEAQMKKAHALTRGRVAVNLLARAFREKAIL